MKIFHSLILYASFVGKMKGNNDTVRGFIYYFLHVYRAVLSRHFKIIMDFKELINRMILKL